MDTLELPVYLVLPAHMLLATLLGLIGLATRRLGGNVGHVVFAAVSALFCLYWIAMIPWSGPNFTFAALMSGLASLASYMAAVVVVEISRINYQAAVEEPSSLSGPTAAFEVAPRPATPVAPVHRRHAA